MVTKYYTDFFCAPSCYLLLFARIRSWNQPVLCNKGKVSCSRKQRGPLMGLKPTTSMLRVRRATHCTTPPPLCVVCISIEALNTPLIYRLLICSLQQATYYNQAPAQQQYYPNPAYALQQQQQQYQMYLQQQQQQQQQQMMQQQQQYGGGAAKPQMQPTYQQQQV